jgi:hypothetical protein
VQGHHGMPKGRTDVAQGGGVREVALQSRDGERRRQVLVSP